MYATALARIEERERIADDLHDGVVQTLFAVSTRLAVGARTGQDTAQLLEDARRHINSAIEQLRSYVEALPGASLREGLMAVIDELGTAGARIEVTELPAAADALPANTTGELLQIVREAVSNALRHGRARCVVVRGRELPGRLMFTIGDDGRGFDARVGRRASGLTSMRRRATRLGGRLRVRSRPGHGTTVRIELPLQRPRSSAFGWHTTTEGSRSE
jgi:signal transduction histidine kinase